MNKRPIKHSSRPLRPSKSLARGHFGPGKTLSAPVGVPRGEMDDPHRMLLSNAAFDAFADALETPQAPSEGARQAVARARLWRR